MPKPKEVRLATFDTEGTSLVQGDENYACLYYWDYLHCDVDPSEVTKDTVGFMCSHVSGRDCSSLYRETLEMLEDAEDCDFRYLVGVHNLSYDICYFRRFLKGLDGRGYRVEVSAKSSTRFLTVSVYRKETLLFTFFDTLALFGISLRTLGENLQFDKLYIDYYEMNSPETPLSKENVDYNDRDTEILMVGICQSLLKRPHVDLESLGRTVLTRTSIVRKGDREEPRIGGLPLAARKSRSKKGGEARVASKPTTVYDVDRLTLKRHQFACMGDYMSWASYGDTLTTDIKGFFAGGVNVSNTNYIGRVVREVVSYDLKSAYPAIMLSYRVPTEPRKVPDSDLGGCAALLDNVFYDPVDVITCRHKFWYGTVRFRGFEVDPLWAVHVGDTSLTQTMVLQHRENCSHAVFKSGYVSSADELVLKLSFSEFAELCLQYTWDSAEFVDLTVYDSSERPTYYSTLRTLFHYREKTVAKEVSKYFKKGVRPPQEDVDSWLREGFLTYDEHEAISSWQVDSDWVESFVLAHKGNLNSLYGINVTSPLKEEYRLDGNGFLEATPDVDRFANYLDSSRNSLMWREAGVCIALFNRYKIVFMARQAVEAGADVVYVDTDSIKSVGISKEVLDSVYEGLHSRIEAATVELVQETVDAVNARLSEYDRQTGEGVPLVTAPSDKAFRDLGKLDYEGTYERFVTMGHKKYAVWEGGRWQFRCSGYNLKVLNAFGAQLQAQGLGDLVPLVVLGYDNRYDSSTGIATVQQTVPDTWVHVSFDAVEGRYEGETCPGYAILPSGKVMNDTEGSPMNESRMATAFQNAPHLRECSRMDVRRDGGTFTFGRRGTVNMDWKDWHIDYNEGSYTA